MSLARVIAWIDQGYDDGIATSNQLLGVVVSVVLLGALVVGGGPLSAVFVGLAIAVSAFFGWRMSLSFKRQADASDRRKKRDG